MIPMAGYEFFYVTYQRNVLNTTTTGTFPKGTYLWHDVVGSCAFHFLLNEFNGLTLEPKVTAKFGEGRGSSDMLNVSASFGYVRAF